MYLSKLSRSRLCRLCTPRPQRPLPIGKAERNRKWSLWAIGFQVLQKERLLPFITAQTRLVSFTRTQTPHRIQTYMSHWHKYKTCTHTHIHTHTHTHISILDFKFKHEDITHLHRHTHTLSFLHLPLSSHQIERQMLRTSVEVNSFTKMKNMWTKCEKQQASYWSVLHRKICPIQFYVH